MHGVRKHERYSQRGKGHFSGGGGVKGEKKAKQYPSEATRTNGPQNQ